MYVLVLTVDNTHTGFSNRYVEWLLSEIESQMRRTLDSHLGYLDHRDRRTYSVVCRDLHDSSLGKNPDEIRGRAWRRLYEDVFDDD